MSQDDQKNNKVIFPSVDRIKDRFIFIADDDLRENISIAFQYIIFLIGLEEKHGISGAIEYSRNKDVILYTGTIIESCIYYVILEFLQHGLVKNNQIMSWEWKEDVCKRIHRIENSDKEICGIFRHKKYKRFTKDLVQFQELNKIALKLEILNQTLFDDAEYVRDRRNKVHLIGLKKGDDLFSKEDVDKIFSKSEKIISRVEDKINFLKKKSST